jgi:hypothetical protein
MGKVIFISTVLPTPVDHGKSVVLSGILEYLFKRYGAERVTYLLLGGSNDERSLEKKMPCRLLTFKKPNVIRQLYSVFWFGLMKRTKSIQESMLYSARLGRELRAVVAETEPDLVFCDTSRTGRFSRLLSV